jgi:hypothetical protein
VALCVRECAVAALFQLGGFLAAAVGLLLEPLGLGLQTIGFLAPLSGLRADLGGALLVRARLLAVLVALTGARFDDLLVGAPAARDQERQRGKRQHDDDDDDCGGHGVSFPLKVTLTRD